MRLDADGLKTAPAGQARRSAEITEWRHRHISLLKGSYFLQFHYFCVLGVLPQDSLCRIPRKPLSQTTAF
jgi:hypothetical protein